jgi:hypothetical protein
MLKPHERLYLQYRPDSDHDRDALLQWQAALHEANPQARPVRPTQLHLTIIHFGILADVFRELKQVVYDLTWDTYEQAVTEFMVTSSDVLPASAVVVADKFSRYGSNAGVIAVDCKAGDDLIEAHQQSLQLLMKALEQCGVQQPVGFMQGSPNFRFALEFSPHISLLKAARTVPADVRTMPHGHAFQLQAMPLHYQ